MTPARYVDALVTRLTLGDRIAGFDGLLVALLRALAGGCPVSPAELARRVGWPVARVVGALREVVSLEWDEEGCVVGYGLTLRETPHAFWVGERRLYTWCAFDTLLFPTLIGQAAQVASCCPVTGVPITLTVLPDTLHSVQPADAVVSLILPQATEDLRHAFCCHVHFFASSAIGQEWAGTRLETEIVSVEEAFMAGRARAQQLLQRVRQGS